MIYAVGHISGAHFNPLTLAFWSVGDFLSRRCGISLPNFWERSRSLVPLFGTQPGIWNDRAFWPTLGGFLAEVIISFALMFVIMSGNRCSRCWRAGRDCHWNSCALAAFLWVQLRRFHESNQLGSALLAVKLCIFGFTLSLPWSVLALTRVYEWIRCQKLI